MSVACAKCGNEIDLSDLVEAERLLYEIQQVIDEVEKNGYVSWLHQYQKADRIKEILTSKQKENSRKHGGKVEK